MFVFIDLRICFFIWLSLCTYRSIVQKCMPMPNINIYTNRQRYRCIRMCVCVVCVYVCNHPHVSALCGYSCNYVLGHFTCTCSYMHTYIDRWIDSKCKDIWTHAVHSTTLHYMLTYACICTYKLMHTYTRTCVLTHVHARTHARAHRHTWTDGRRDRQTHRKACMHACMLRDLPTSAC